MNKMKYSVLFLVTALILILSSCSGMMTETDDVSIDLSSVISRTIGDMGAVDTVKVWLVAEGSNNFYELPDGEASQDISVDDATITLTHIPAGPVYRIYMSIGEDDGTKFTIKKSVTGLISVTGGTSIDKTLTSADLKTSIALVGEAVKGAAFVNNKLYTAAANGTKIYTVAGTVESEQSVAYTVTDIDKGYYNSENAVMVTTSGKTDRKAIGTIGSGDILEFTYSDELPADVPGADPFELLSSFFYYDSASGMQLGISQMNGGITISVYGDFDGGPSTDWVSIDFSDVLDNFDAVDLELNSKFFKGFSAIKKTDYIWLFVSSKIGDFRISIPISGAGLGTLDSDIFNVLVNFASGNEYLKDRVILNLDNNSNEFLYVGTDSGLYKMTATSEVGDMVADEIFAEGQRIERLKSGTNYTACITPLNLLLIDNDGNVATVAFNEGLPADPETGLLNAADGKGITGLDWNGNTLYITGGYGLASIDASAASLWE